MSHFLLEKQGATWWHTQDYHSPNLSKASLGEFFFEVIKVGAEIGTVWAFNRNFNRSAVYITVFMTEDMKNELESKFRYRFVPPPVISSLSIREERDVNG
jgi:hypothetical protein